LRGLALGRLLLLCRLLLGRLLLASLLLASLGIGRVGLGRLFATRFAPFAQLLLGGYSAAIGTALLARLSGILDFSGRHLCRPRHSPEIAALPSRFGRDLGIGIRGPRLSLGVSSLL
jgi:hypothetical protein